MSGRSDDWSAWVKKADHDFQAPQLTELIDDAVFLSPLAVFARYPGDPGEPSRADAERGVRIAKRIRDAVCGHLPQVGP